MKKRLNFLIVLILVTGITGISSQTPIHYKLKQGQVFHYAIESQYPNTGPAEFSLGLYFNFKVLAADKSSYRIQLLFDKVYVSNENDYYNSLSGLPPFGTIQQYYGYLVGKPVIFTMSKDGTEFNVEGIGPLVDSIAKAYYKTNFSEKTQIRQFLRNDMINPAIHLVFAQYKENTKKKTFNKLFETAKNAYDNNIDSWKQKASHTLTMIMSQSSYGIMRFNVRQKNAGYIFVNSYIDKRSYSRDQVSGIPVNVQLVEVIKENDKGISPDFQDSLIVNIRQLKDFKLSKKTTIYGKITNVPGAVRISLTGMESERMFNFNPDYLIFNVDSLTNKDGTFSFTRELDRVTTVEFSTPYKKERSIFIKPGDSICVTADYHSWDISFSVQGSLTAYVTRLFYEMRDYSTSFSLINWKVFLKTQVENAQKNSNLNLPKEQKYYSSLRSLDSISNLVDPEISRYIKTNVDLNKIVTNSVFWLKPDKDDIVEAHLRISEFIKESDRARYTIHSPGYRQYVISFFNDQLNLDQNDPPQKLYFYAKYYLPYNEIRYYVMANCVYKLCNRLKVNEAKELLVDFEKTYPKSEYASSLQKIISRKVDLSPGSIAPDFTLKDVDGQNVSLSDFKDKWVLLFVNNDELDYVLEQEVRVAMDVKAKVPADKFEVIWVMTGEKKRSIDKVIKDCSQLGTVLLNPGWKDKLFNNYKDEFYFQMHIISPGNKIEGNMGFSLDISLSNQLIDSINNDETKKESSFVSIKTLLWILGIIIFVFVIVFAIYRRRMAMLSLREARQREKLDLELKAIRSQLNPHFMFNSLSSIQHLVNDNRVDDANHYLSSFSGLMRRVLHHSDQELVPLENELDTIRQYLELEALRFNFKFMIEVDPNIDIFNIEIPPMLLQPFVENAVIHGIAAMQDKGEIAIKVCKEEKKIVICIEDNGTGIAMSKVEDGSNSNGKGLSLTRKRMDLISKSFANNMVFNIVDLANENKQGTRVTISFDVD